MQSKTVGFLIYSTTALILLFSGCKSSTIVNPVSPPSSLTRSGKFVSFTSNLEGGRYNIFLAQVDANGYLVSSGLIFQDNPYDLTQPFNSSGNKQSNWSPDGRILVFSAKQSDNSEVIYAYFFSANGRLDSTKAVNPESLGMPGAYRDENPQFSPDGNYLVWDRSANMDSVARDLYIANITYDTSGMSLTSIRSITNTPTKDEYDPKWSPRNSVRRIAYTFAGSITATDHDVWVMDPFDTSNNIDFYEPGKSSYPAWSPDCSRIIFESDNGNSGYFKIVSLSYPPSGSPTDIVNDAGAQANDRYPTWRPNGDLIAYVKIPDVTHLGNIYIVSSTGGSYRALLPSSFSGADNLYPAW